MKELILGGVKSGKSRYAEQRAQASGLTVTYVATATADDNEMQARILKHQQQRDRSWSLIEEPVRLGDVIARHADPTQCLLIDCLTLWLSNLLCLDDEDTLQTQIQHLLTAIKNSPAHIILVSNETSMGIIPMGELSRRYCDEAGKLHQQLAQLCDRVILTIAGLPQALKGELHAV